MENNEQSIIERLEDSINQGLLKMQEMAGSAKEEAGNISNVASVSNTNLEIVSKNSPIAVALQPITHTIHIFTNKLKNILEAAEITLEYINTGDSITIVGKVA